MGVTTVGERVREVRDDEVEFYKQNGWAKLDQLIPSDLAGEMLAAVKEKILGADAESFNDRPERSSTVENEGGIKDYPAFRDWHYVARDQKLEPFHSVAFSRQVGRAAQRLMDRDVPVKYTVDAVGVKMPAGHGASKPTGFHQDYPSFPFDRIGQVAVWIALDDLPADCGVMRFYSGSHREGPLGRGGFTGVPLTERYPHISERYELSPPLDLKAGDATVHHGLVVHGAPENTTDIPRWAFILGYHPGDALYTGAPHHIFTPMQLEVDKPIDHPLAPVVYP